MKKFNIKTCPICKKSLKLNYSIYASYFCPVLLGNSTSYLDSHYIVTNESPLKQVIKLDKYIITSTSNDLRSIITEINSGTVLTSMEIDSFENIDNVLKRINKLIHFL